VAIAFPENDIEVLRRYVPDDLHGALIAIRAELERVFMVSNMLSVEMFETIDGPLDPDQDANQASAFAVNEARRKFLAALDEAQLGLPDKPPAIQSIDTAVDEMLRHELPGAAARLAAFDTDTPPINNLGLDRATIELAQTTAQIPFIITRVTNIINTPNGPREIRVRNDAFLGGIAGGAVLSGERIEQLLTALSFLTRTWERVFRLGIMHGEALFGQRQFEPAIEQFAALLPKRTGHPGWHFDFRNLTAEFRPAEVGAMPSPSPGFAVVVARTHLSRRLDDILGNIHDLEVLDESGDQQPPLPSQMFAAIRIAFTRLGQADALYRRQGQSIDAAASQAIKETYESAVAVLARVNISAGNPLRQQIEKYVAQQLAKLAGHLNFLGYLPTYVPILRPAALQTLAERRIDAAAAAASRFEMFKARADQLQDQLQDLDVQREIKDKELAIADQQLGKARDQVGIADRQVEQLQNQIDSLATATAVSIGGDLFQAAASAALAGSTGPAGSVITGTSVPGVVGALSGVASTVAGYSARKEDLRLQKEMAGLQAGIARRDVEIAALGREITELTADSLADRIRSIQAREFNPDLYYAAGEAFRALAERHLDAATLWCFLFERSVAFLRLEPELQTIGMDYLSGPGGLLAAPDRLRADLEDVVNFNLPITKFQFLTETVSLRSLYPLEFSRFLQTGRMDFAMSLYELNKRRPGVYRQRIKRVEVQLQFPPPTGFTGRIRHRGSFLLRDKDTTPAPGSGTFVPSEADIAAALAAMGAGASQGVPIGGVIPLLLDVDTLELSADQTPPDLGDPSPESLSPIEGYGPAGDWTLEVENVDLRFITDALLKITTVIPESDEPLSERVKGLLAAYEQQLAQDDALDLISPLSLRQRFPDAFATLAGAGAQFSLVRNDFPAGIANLRLKSVVMQALDAQKKGIAGLSLELTRPGTALRVERTTHAGGFSEDLGAAIPNLPDDQRLDPVGGYALRLVTPGPVAVAELLLFFVYAFEEV
jgi:hypothetical protein